MRCNIRLATFRVGILSAGFTVLLGTTALAVTSSTVTFQEGANGYSGGQDIRISMTASRDGTNGNSVGNYLIDGWETDDPDTEPIENSPDEQELISFPNIFGNGAGQIPLGATILDAQLTYKTFDTGTTPPSGGPWGVAALLQPFTTATRYADFPSSNGNPLLPSRGAWFEDGYATRPTGAYAGTTNPPLGTGQLGAVVDADVWPLVQRWSDDPEGDNNHGFVVQAGWTGATNGWGFFTNGAATVANRPKLSVTYTTDPIEVNVFQRDLNGYTGDTVARPSSGSDINSPSDDVTVDGTTVTGAHYIDGNDAGTDARLRGLVKFTSVFGAGANQAPADKPVEKAWLVLTTGVGNDHRSPGVVNVHQMLRDWDVTSLYSNFGAVPGLTEADGDISAPLDANRGMTNGSESWFDVTSYLENVRLNPGNPDYGFAITPSSNDGWAMMLNGATDISVRPRLVVYSDLLAAPGLDGDHNGDGKVDAADYVAWRKLPGSFGGDPGGYNDFRENFGEGGPGGGGSAVPEPAAWLIGALSFLAMTFIRARKQVA
jgi:hypothetical protein